MRGGVAWRNIIIFGWPLGGRGGEVGMVPNAARAAVRSPAERVGRDGDGPNAVCDVIRTRNASTFVPAPAPEPRDGSPKTWEQPLTLMNPENLAQRRSRACRSWCGRLTLDSLTRGLEAKTDVLVVAGTGLAGTRRLALGAEAVGRDERRDGGSAWRSRGGGKKTRRCSRRRRARVEARLGYAPDVHAKLLLVRLLVLLSRHVA